MRILLKALIMDMVRQFRWRMGLLVFLMVASSLLDGMGLALLYPLLALAGLGKTGEPSRISEGVESIFSSLGVPLSILSVVILVVAVFFVQNLLFLAQGWWAAQMQHRYVVFWRSNLFRSYMGASWSFFTKNKAGTLINSLIGEADRLGGAFYLVTQLASASTVCSVYLGLSFFVSWQITLGILLVGLCLSFVTFGMVKIGYRVGKGISAGVAELQTVTGEVMQGAKVIKATATEEDASLRFQGVAERLRKYYFWSSFQPNILKSLFEFSSVCIFCVMLFISASRGLIDPAAVLVIAAIFFRLLPRLFALQQNLQLLGGYLPAIGVISQFEGEAKSHREIAGDAKVRIFQGSVGIAFQSVSFSYENDVILQDISLEIASGGIAGIVGGSGAGKTTLVDCLLHLMEPSSGVILVENIPLESLSLHGWRRCVGYVSQETFLFNDSIRNNLLWGSLGANFEDALEACRKAQIHEFIESLPEGYDTHVGDRGVRLSGGQKQRIGLARALVHRPSLLILDEATSALDSYSEQQVMRAIEKLRGECTMVIVAHRLSTVRCADVIHVLEKGDLVEQGSWNDLLQKNGRFRQLWEMQNRV